MNTQLSISYATNTITVSKPLEEIGTGKIGAALVKDFDFTTLQQKQALLSIDGKCKSLIEVVKLLKIVTGGGLKWAEEKIDLIRDGCKTNGESITVTYFVIPGVDLKEMFAEFGVSFSTINNE